MNRDEDDFLGVLLVVVLAIALIWALLSLVGGLDAALFVEPRP